MSWEKKLLIPPYDIVSSVNADAMQGDSTHIRYVCDKSKEEESPGEWIEQSFSKLVPLEVLVTNTLLIDPDTFDTEDAVLLTQPTGVQLVVRYCE